MPVHIKIFLPGRDSVLQETYERLSATPPKIFPFLRTHEFFRKSAYSAIITKSGLFFVFFRAVSRLVRRRAGFSGCGSSVFRSRRVYWHAYTHAPKIAAVKTSFHWILGLGGIKPATADLMFTPNLKYLYFHIKMILTRILLVLPVLALTAAAEYKVVLQDKCYVFTDDTGEEVNKFCDIGPDLEYVKLKNPVIKEGTTRNWMARKVVNRSLLLTTAIKNMVLVENLNEHIVLRRRKAGKEELVYPEFSRGYRLRYYGDRGNLLWEKTVQGKGSVIMPDISRDGSTLVLFTKCETPEYCPKLKKTEASVKRLTVYGNDGRELMIFPAKPGICDIRDLAGFWMSRRGSYIYIPCGADKSGTPYFLKPKARLFWKPKKFCVLSTRVRGGDKEEEWPAFDEETGRIQVFEGELSEPGPEEGRKMVLTEQASDLILSEVDWHPLSQLP